MNVKPSQLLPGDCIKVLRKFPKQSVDLVLADPPFATTDCKWDVLIPLPDMWEMVGRVVKPGRAVALNCQEPFTSVLISSNYDWFRYRWTWDKGNRVTGFLDAQRRPLKVIEDIAVFSTEGWPKPYYPQMVQGKGRVMTYAGTTSDNYRGRIKKEDRKKWECYGKVGDKDMKRWSDQYLPKDLIEIDANTPSEDGKGHPTQKPVRLCEYLIKTYTKEGDLVLDFTMGSGTTGVACARLNRRFVGVEKDPAIFAQAERRIRAAEATGLLVPANKNGEQYGFFK